MPKRRGSARAFLVAVLAIGLIAAGALAWIGTDRSDRLAPRPVPQRPPLMLVTSLPLIFPEEFGVDDVGLPTLEALETRYRIEPIGVTDAPSLSGGNSSTRSRPIQASAPAASSPIASTARMTASDRPRRAVISSL